MVQYYTDNIPATAHNKARFFKVGNLITGQSNFSSSRDALSSLHVLRHGGTFTRQQGVAETERDNRWKTAVSVKKKPGVLTGTK